jgi:hypothetical protein
MPGPEKMMIGTSFVAFIIAVVMSLSAFVGGLGAYLKCSG